MDELFMGSVTVGERGQVVIPAEAREKLGLEPGDKMLALLHPSHHMVCLCKLTMVEALTDFLGRLEVDVQRAEDEDDTGESDE